MTFIYTTNPIIDKNGNKSWWNNSKLHRENGLPAVENFNGSKEWWVNGELHRDGDLPAFEHKNSGTFWGNEWWKNGKCHRDNDLPAVEGYGQNNRWYKNGVLHRDNDLPAIDCEEQGKQWFKNGVLHRDNNLPAVECKDGGKEWWLNGHKCPPYWVRLPKLSDMTGKCCITLDTIDVDSEVCRCNVCSVILLFDALNKWLNISYICPHCRSPWRSYIKYV